MSGRRSRNKGKRGELSAARAMSEVLGVPARRGQQFSGVEGKDVVVEIPGLHVEVKRTEKLSLYPAMEQAAYDAEPDEVPLVLHRRNAKSWLVILNLEDLMKLVRAIDRGTQTVRAIIRECREMTKTELVIRTPFLKGRRRERDEILCELIERRETEVEQDLSGGRPRTIIRWIAA